MRSTRWHVVQVGTGLPLAVLLPASPSRVALLVSPQDLSDVLYLTTEPGAPALLGICIPPGTPSLLLRCEDLGDIVQAAWYASAGTGQDVAVLEVSAGKPSSDGSRS